MKNKASRLFLQSFSVFCLALLLATSLFWAGCGGEEKTGTSHPYYQQGLSHRQNNRMEESAEAFKKCLRLSPGTTRAHFQLGTLYEDHLNEPIKALYHYSMFLGTESEQNENTRVAENSIEQIKRDLFTNWAEQYPELVETQTDQEELEKLKAELEELGEQVNSLRQARDNLIRQTRDLISRIREKDARIAELED